MRVRMWRGTGSWMMVGSLAAVADGGLAGDRQERSLGFIASLGSVLSLLHGACAEYAQAVCGHRVQDGAAYLASRGLYMAARDRLAAVEAAAAAHDAPMVALVRAEVDRLLPAWASPVVPAAPVLEPSDVVGAIARIELGTGLLPQRAA